MPITNSYRRYGTMLQWPAVISKVTEVCHKSTKESDWLELDLLHEGGYHKGGHVHGEEHFIELPSFDPYLK